MKELLSYKRGIQAHFEQEAPFLLSCTRFWEIAPVCNGYRYQSTGGIIRPKPV